MEILVIDAYFYPELTAFSHLEEDLLKGLVDAGNVVNVVCPTPSRGIDRAVAKRYSKIKSETLYGGKISVKRYHMPKESKNPILRALRYGLCNLKAYSMAKKHKNIDVVFANSTPPIQGKICAKIARKLSKKYKRHVPFVYNLQDIFPDSLVNAGLATKGSLLWKLGRKIEDKTYQSADKIIVISDDFKRNIMAKGVPESKIEVVYNWVDTDKVKPIKRAENKLFDEYGIDRNNFVVVYAGNFGLSQGVDIIVDTAALLKDNKDIKFVLFGDGAKYNKVKEYAESLCLDNVIINPLLKSDRISEVYSMGNVCLITCKKGFGECAFPSKTWSIMACNSYIIASYDVNSELADIIAKSNCGQVVEPENADKLAKAILQAKENIIKASGRCFVMQFADKKVCVNKYIKVFSILQKTSSSKNCEKVLEG